MTHLFFFRRILFGKPKLNKIVVLLTLSDIFTWGLHLVLTAIVGIYLSERIGQDTVQIVGVGIAIYMASRGLLELPVGKFVDSWKSDTDEITLLAIGNALMGASYLFYPLIQTASLYFTLQFVFAVGAAMSIVSSRKLFAQNLDKNAEGFEYGEYGLVIGLASAAFSILAGTIANLGIEYFNIVIVAIGIMMIISSIFPLLIFKVKNRKSNFFEKVQERLS